MRTTIGRGVLAGLVIALSWGGQAMAYVPPSASCHVAESEAVTREGNRTIYWVCDGVNWRARSVCIDDGHCELIFD